MKIILPGMGANSKMYSGPWLDLDEAVFVDWPNDLHSYTLDSISKWLAEKHPKCDCVVGSSLGGMIGLKYASKIGCDNVVLLGSAVNYGEISAILKMLHPISGITPFKLLRMLSGSVPILISEMYTETSDRLIHESIKDLPNFSWSDERVNVHRIHGKYDPIIPCPKNVNLLVDGGHLIGMSHAKESCKYIIDNEL